jgi:hypothetical protein
MYILVHPLENLDLKATCINFFLQIKGTLILDHSSHTMAQKCQHKDMVSETECNCPHFVSRTNLAAFEATTCDGCLHSVAWHSIPASNSQAPSSSTQMIDQILSLYSTQSAAIGSMPKAGTKGPKRKARVASKEAAHQEAVAGFRKGYGSNEEASGSKVSAIAIPALLVSLNRGHRATVSRASEAGNRRRMQTTRHTRPCELLPLFLMGSM